SMCFILDLLIVLALLYDVIMRLVIPRDELSSLNIFFNEDSVTKGTMTLAKETLVKMKAILFI
ncbi:MAG: hypothetical protein WBF33_20630, partial [Candidatus Nitrosopolaris sp.]